MAEYLAKMKSISDNLLLAGSPISNNDLIIQTLFGLDIEYNPIVVQLFDKIDLTWVDVQAALLTFESRLEQLSNLTNSFQARANLVSGGFGKQRSSNSETTNNSWRSQNQGNKGGRASQGRGGRGARNNI